MANVNITQQSLLMFDDELQAMRGSVIFVLLASRIREFYNKNGSRIGAIRDKRSELWKEFLVIENDQIQFDEEKDDKGEVYKRPKMKEEIRRKEFQDKMNELMQKQVQIDV